MPRIFGVTIPDNKKILYSLPYLYGVGLTSSGIILKSAGIDPDKKAGTLTGEELGKIQKIIERNYRIEGDLRKEIAQNQKHYKEIGSWHGSRLSRRLPIRGRTKTNSRTTRGNVRKTMGSGRTKAEGKT
jgi:small subunit ribosomal protein S13